MQIIYADNLFALLLALLQADFHVYFGRLLLVATLLRVALNEGREHDACAEYLVDGEKRDARDQTVAQATVQEHVVVVYDVVDVGDLAHDALLEQAPARLEHLERHVVEEILHEVEHTLSECAGHRVVPGRAAHAQLAGFCAQPHTSNTSKPNQDKSK